MLRGRHCGVGTATRRSLLPVWCWDRLVFSVAQPPGPGSTPGPLLLPSTREAPSRPVQQTGFQRLPAIPPHTHPGIRDLELPQDILRHVVFSHRVHYEVLIAGGALGWPVLVTFFLWRGRQLWSARPEARPQSVVTSLPTPVCGSPGPPCTPCPWLTPHPWSRAHPWPPPRLRLIPAPIRGSPGPSPAAWSASPRW